MQTKLIMGLILALIVLALVKSILKRDRSMTSRISLEDLLLGDDGKISKAASVMLGSFACTTWMMVYLAMNDKMTEGYFAAYLAAWVIPTVTKLIKGPMPSMTTETTSIETNRTTTPVGPTS